jgi:predicted PurR-regulated permease PerM
VVGGSPRGSECGQRTFEPSRVDGVIEWGRSFGRELVGRLVILVFTLLTLFFAYRDGPTIINQARIIGERLHLESASAGKPLLRFAQP